MQPVFTFGPSNSLRRPQYCDASHPAVLKPRVNSVSRQFRRLKGTQLVFRRAASFFDALFDALETGCLDVETVKL